MFSGSRSGLFNLDGTMILLFEYKYMSEFVDGKALVQKNDYNWYIIDMSGNIIKKLDESIKFAYTYMYPSGYIAFTKEGDGIHLVRSIGEWGFTHWGYMDREGNILFELKDKLTDVTQFSQGRAVITVWDGFNALIVDISGRIIKDLGMANNNLQGGLHDGIACVNGRINPANKPAYGAIDMDGNWVIEPNYQKMYYSNGVITAKTQDAEYEFYDTKGNLLSAYCYPCTYFEDGYFFMLKEDRFFLMDINGYTIMQLPQGYMPVRSDYTNLLWRQWETQHKQKPQ
jgi:hypothetical protein